MRLLRWRDRGYDYIGVVSHLLFLGGWVTAFIASLCGAPCYALGALLVVMIGWVGEKV